MDLQTYYKNKQDYLNKKMVTSETHSEKMKLKKEKEDLKLFFEEQTRKIRQQNKPPTVAPKPAKKEPIVQKKSTVVEKEEDSIKTDDNLEYKVVLYYSPFCGFCKKIKPTMREIVKEYEGLVSFDQINCKSEDKPCSKLHIKGYPTLILYKKDHEVAKMSGAKPIEEIRDFIDKGTW